MPYDPEIHHRRSVRLRGYDYAQAGAYFVTVVTQERACLFGEVVGGEMRMSEAGRMLERWWAELEKKYPRVIPDAHIVMPNHFHGIIITDGPVGADVRGYTPGVCPNSGACVGADLRVCPSPHVAACPGDQGAHAGAPLPEMVQWFKTMTTNEYMRAVKTLGWRPFLGRLWQRNYYEHVIRDEDALGRIRIYVEDNPTQWESDHEYQEGRAAV